MKYLVLGLGCLWAACLAKSEGNKISLIHNRPTFVDAIKRNNGLILRTVDKSRPRQDELVNVQAFTNILDGLEFLDNECDCVLVLVKVFNTSRILKQLKKEMIKKLSEKKTVFCTLQNSLSNVEQLEKYFPKPLIMFGTTVTNAVSPKDGVVEGTPSRPTSVWSASNSMTPEMKKVARNFSASGLATSPTKDAELMLWKKMAVNCAINSVTTLTLLKVRPSCVESGGVGKDLMREIAAEVAKVAQGEGITLSEKEAIDSLDFVTRKAGNHVSSMLNDVLNRRQTEIDNTNGYVIRCAQKHHVQVPVIRTAYLLIKLLQDSYGSQLQPVQLRNLK